MRKKRHYYTPEEKVSILRRHWSSILQYPICVTNFSFSRRFFTFGRSSFSRMETLPLLPLINPVLIYYQRDFHWNWCGQLTVLEEFWKPVWQTVQAELRPLP